MLECGREHGGTAHNTIRFSLGRRFFLLLTGAALVLLMGQAESVCAAGFFTTGSMGTARQDHTATLLDNGTVLITGGATTSLAILASAEVYNPLTGVFSATTGAMPGPRRYHTATKLASGKVLIAGGASTSTTSSAGLATAVIYDPATGTFAPTGSLNTGRKFHTATLLDNGKVLITGGRTAGSSTTLSTAELFDPTANGGVGAFTTTTSPMSIPRESHTASLLTDNGKVLIAGGITTGSAATATAQLYDPVANTFTTTGPMHVARNYHAAVVLFDGSVLITGGTSVSAGASLATAEIYDPALGTFGAGTLAMNAGHSRHTATLLSDGNVLVAGDLSGAGIPGSAADFFLWGDGVFIPIDSMKAARSNFRAIPLNNGIVLLTGGATASGPIAAAELFNPSGVTITPAGHTFTDTGIGFTSAPRTFTISTNADLAIAPFSFTGTDSTMFTVSGATCSTQTVPVPDPENPPPPSVPTGGSCTVSVTFTPSSAGLKSAALIIATDDPYIQNWSLPLSGNAIVILPTISGTPATSVTAGNTYSFTPTATITTYFSITNQPGWAIFDTLSGTLSGAPTNANVGTYPGIVITAHNVGGSTALPAFTITVQPFPTISGAPAASVTAGTTYSFTPTTTYTTYFSIFNLPGWAGFNILTGTLSGTPTNAQAGIYRNIIITANNTNGSASLPAFDITVNSAPLSISTSSLPSGLLSTFYSQTVAATGGVPPYSWGVLSGILPNGLNLSGSTGLISGTPAKTGVFSFAVWTTDNGAGTTSKPLTITVTDAACANSPVRISGTAPVYYPDFLSAYPAAADSATIQFQSFDFSGDFLLDRDLRIKLDGGYNCGYTANAGATGLLGELRVNNGTVKVGNLRLK